MRYDIDVNGRLREVTVERRDGRLIVSTGEERWLVDAAAVGGQMLSLLMARLEPGDDSDVRVEPDPDATVTSHEIPIAVDPVSRQLLFGIGPTFIAATPNARRRRTADDGHSGAAGPQRIVAPMPGKVVRVMASVGDSVERRQPVVVIEAMKMENELRATGDGRVAELHVREGQSVEAGVLLAVIAPQ